MTTIYAQNRLLPEWLTRIRTRQLALPRFQRDEAWPHTTVTQMLNTILQGLPVGVMLVLEIGNEQPFVHRPIVGAPEDGERVTEHLLDGQQRLTALWRSLHNNYEDRTYFVHLVRDEETQMPYYVESLRRWKNSGDAELRPFWCNDPVRLWEKRMIPLDLFMPNEAANTAYSDWARCGIPSSSERETVAEMRYRIREQFSTFNLPFLSLPVTTARETALDVFIQMNTSSVELGSFDIVVAQFEAVHGEGLHDRITDIKRQCPNISKYYKIEDLSLYASALLQRRSPSKATYLDTEFVRCMIGNWQSLARGISKVVEFLEAEKIFDSKRLPTDLVVPILTALWANTPDGLDGEGRARAVYRTFLWRAFFTDRYERSTNTRALADYLAIRTYLTDQPNDPPAIFNLEQHPLPTVDELKEAGWPAKKDRLARAILALALSQGGCDLADGGQVNQNNLTNREYHHLFPRAYLRERGFDDSQINRSLNCALVTWRTNRAIAARSPMEYLRDRLDNVLVSEDEISERLESHLVPHYRMAAGDYEVFLSERANMIHNQMLRACRAMPEQADD